MNIKNLLGRVIFASTATLLEDAVVEAVKRGANLRDANLYGANLTGADLRGADLYGANLRDANLYGANLIGANLIGANLIGANLIGANLYGANLRGADLTGANLTGADLRGADLRGADLRGAKNAELTIARISHIPSEGPFWGWKKCQAGVLVKLLIPEGAKRSHGAERKCRASVAIVLEIIGATEARSLHDTSFIYRVGEKVTPSGWNENRWETCGEGIHFYITKEEAEAHQ